RAEAQEILIIFGQQGAMFIQRFEVIDEATGRQYDATVRTQEYPLAMCCFHFCRSGNGILRTIIIERSPWANLCIKFLVRIMLNFRKCVHLDTDDAIAAVHYQSSHWCMRYQPDAESQSAFA